MKTKTALFCIILLFINGIFKTAHCQDTLIILDKRFNINESGIRLLRKKLTHKIDTSFSEPREGNYLHFCRESFNYFFTTTIFDSIVAIGAFDYIPNGVNKTDRLDNWISVMELNFQTDLQAIFALDALYSVPLTEVKFLPPINWYWRRHKNKIYFVMSYEYAVNSPQMKELQLELTFFLSGR